MCDSIALRRRSKMPLKIRILTALWLGELSIKQLSLMLDSSVRTIEIELSHARKRGDIRTARIDMQRRRRHGVPVGYYTLTEQGFNYARKIVCQS